MKRLKRTSGVITLLTLILMLGLAGCKKSSSDTIKIATKPMTEQLILGEMLDILIEDRTDLEVELTKGVGGGTANIQPAMESGEFDLYAEYTGTGWSTVLKMEGIPPHEELYPELVEKYKEHYDFDWVGLYGFNNTYGLAVRKDIAEKYNLKTFSDLAACAGELTFGANYDFFEREDGYDGLCETYGYKFGKRVDLDIGLKYQAIESGEIDVTSVFTTDGQLSSSGVVVLEDDKDYYQTYYCGTVVRGEVLEKHSELRDVLMLMQDILAEEEMSSLNYEVEENKRDERDVAMEYLQAKGLMKDEK